MKKTIQEIKFIDDLAKRETKKDKQFLAGILVLILIISVSVIWFFF